MPKAYSPARPQFSITLFTGLLLSLLTIAALWIRISALAERQLAWDEYFFVNSVKNILEYGLPQFKSGGYYTRGLLPQYLSAVFIFLFGDGYFAYRLQAALFGAATVIVGFFLARQFLSRPWSILLAAILAFSSWQIELSIFARMYAAFQFITACFFLSFYRYSFNEESNKKYITVGLAFISILTHELGIVIVMFLFLPLFSYYGGDLRKTLYSQYHYILICVVVALFAYFACFFDFRSLGVSGQLPADYILPVNNVFGRLSFGVGLFGASWFFSVASLVSIGFLGWFVKHSVRYRQFIESEEQWLGGLLTLAVCCAVFHQFAMVSLIISVIILRRFYFLLKKPYVTVFILLIAIVLFWLVMLMNNLPMVELNESESFARNLRRALRIAFFGLPDIYLPVVHPWAKTMPVVSFLIGAAVVYQVFSIRRLPFATIVKNPVVPVMIVVVLFGVTIPPDFDTRYSHFMYPLLICIVLISATQLVSFSPAFRFIRQKKFCRILPLMICLTAFCFGEDFSFFHLTHLNHDSVIFRTGQFERFSVHWYPRFDFRKPAEWVDISASDSSKIIVSSDVQTIGFYLEKNYYIYHPYDARDYALVSRDGGTRELWSGKKMISTIQQIRELSEHAETIWLIRYPKGLVLRESPEGIWQERLKSFEAFTPGCDKRIEVLKIKLTKND